MNYRILGRTGLKISEIGYGAWGIGGGPWQGADDQESYAALHGAADLGVNFIDTALSYGGGHSERLLGRLLKERQEEIIVATKIPPQNSRWPASPGSRLRDVFPAPYIIESTEKSLRNLGVDRIDIQQFHVWRDEWTDDPEWFETVEKLQAQGKIRFFGVSINDHDPASALKLVASGRVDVVQVIYHIFDPSPERALFPRCLEHNVGVIVRAPFDEGALTGSITPATRFPPGDFRNRYFRGNRKKQVCQRVRKLEGLLGCEAHSMPELALRFCLHHPAVSTVIPGMRTLRHVKTNCAFSDGKKLSGKLLSELQLQQWQKNFYQSRLTGAPPWVARLLRRLARLRS